MKGEKLKRFIFLYLLLSPFISFLYAQVTWDQQSLIIDGRRVVPAMGEIHYSRIPAQEWERAVQQMKEHKVPASITLAQGLLESGAGMSTLALESNNHFGIKCGRGWRGTERGCGREGSRRGQQSGGRQQTGWPDTAVL